MAHGYDLENHHRIHMYRGFAARIRIYWEKKIKGNDKAGEYHPWDIISPHVMKQGKSLEFRLNHGEKTDGEISTWIYQFISFMAETKN